MCLLPQEQHAIDSFLAEHWEEFRVAASAFLSEDEIDELGERLCDYPD